VKGTALTAPKCIHATGQQQIIQEGNSVKASSTKGKRDGHVESRPMRTEFMETTPQRTLLNFVL
jgi:hypothetical protein